ncbi:MAG: DUF2812 domain-containing protein [Erysipelotrichaceae bacterium]|nr:DUF2812 domain-containing protein [Erysipelotrichaceae bacterium]
MNLSRDVLVTSKLPWESSHKTETWLNEQAQAGWFLSSFRFRFFCLSVEFTFQRCEPIDADFIYTTMTPQLFNKQEYEENLEDGWYVVAYAENYVCLSNQKPTYCYQDISKKVSS